MPATSEDPATALAIMRDWAWLRYDPDGNPFPPGIALSSIISRLAFEGAGGQRMPCSSCYVRAIWWPKGAIAGASSKT